MTAIMMGVCDQLIKTFTNGEFTGYAPDKQGNISWLQRNRRIWPRNPIRIYNSFR